MDKLPELSTLLRMPTEIRLGNVTYRPKELTITQIAQYTCWLKSRALASLESTLIDVPDHVAEAHRRELRILEASGEFDWGGTACNRSLFTLSGKAKAMELALAENHPEVDDVLALKLVQENERALLPIYRELVKDPKSLAAVMGSLFDGLISSPSSQTSPSASGSTKSDDSPSPKSSGSTSGNETSTELSGSSAGAEVAPGTTSTP